MVNLPQVGVLDLAPTHSKHAKMTYQQLLHLHCIQSGLLAKATELSLAQGVNLLHSSQDCLQASNNVSCGGCGSVIAHALIKSFLPPFYPHVISFTRPSSRLIFAVKGSTAERKAWERGYQGITICMVDKRESAPTSTSTPTSNNFSPRYNFRIFHKCI